MASRNEFFHKIKTYCNKETESPAVLVISEKSVKYLTYDNLVLLSTQLSESVFNSINVPLPTCISLFISHRRHLIPLICGMWQSGHCVVPIEPCAITKSNSKFLCCDIEISLPLDFKIASSFAIDGTKYFLYVNVPAPVVTIHQSWDWCYTLTTSGSTGRPKVVKVPWSCILPNAIDLSSILCITASDVILSVVPPTFDPFFIDIFCALTSGAALLFADPNVPLINAFKMDQTCWNNPVKRKKCCIPDFDDHNFECKWIPTVAKHSATVLQITPSMLYKFFNVSELLCSNSSIQKLILGGERFPSIKETNYCSCQIYNIYGITEVSCWAFVYEVQDCTQTRVQLGKPLADIEFKIVDEELLIGSLRRCFVDEETPDSLLSGGIVYRRTGDIVEVSSGELYFVTRCDSIIKKYGVRVDFQKINDLLTSCGLLKDFTVVYNEDIQLVTWFLEFVESEFNSDCPIQLSSDRKKHIESSILNHLRDIEQPDCLFEAGVIPITSHGKKDYRMLRSFVNDHHRQRKILGAGHILKAVWCEIFNVEDISPGTKFIEYGGNSILALNLISRLHASAIRVPTSLLPHLLGNGTFEECLLLLDENALRNENRNIHFGPRALKLQWDFDLKKCVDATPLLVPIKGENCVVVGSHSHLLCAISSSTGKEVWTRRLSDRIEAGVCSSIDEKLLFVGCYDGSIYCIESETGKIVWVFHCEAMVKCTACLANDASSLFVGSYDKTLYHLSLQGNLLKSIKISEGAILGRPLLTNNNGLCVGTLNGSYACLDSLTFKKMWSGSLSSPIFASPCYLPLENAVIFTEVVGVLHCFDAVTGSKKWQYSCNGNIFSGLTIVEAKGEVCVAFGCHDNHLYLLITSTSPALKWKRQVGSPIYGTPAFGNSLIVCAETRGTLHIFSLAGDIVAIYQLNGEVFSSPIFSCNKIYLGCRSNSVVCLELEGQKA